MAALSKQQQLKKHSKKKTRKQEGKIPPEIYQLVLARDGGRCGVCGRPYQECHHIKNRGTGGRGDDPANLIMLCKDCHYNKIHGRGDYETIRKMYLYMISLDYSYKTELELLDYRHERLKL